MQNYHEFVPWCDKSTVCIDTLKKFNNMVEFKAILNIGYKNLYYGYTSSITGEFPNSIMVIYSAILDNSR